MTQIKSENQSAPNGPCTPYENLVSYSDSDSNSDTPLLSPVHHTSPTSTPSSARTQTNNGALSHATATPLVDFFFAITRTTSEEQLHQLLEKCWNLSPTYCLRVLFHLRDCRGGKGEKLQFYRAMGKLLQSEEGDHIFEEMFPYIVEFGYYKDLLQLYSYASATTRENILRIFAVGLQQDRCTLLESMNADVAEEKKTVSISLIAKWAPTENMAFDRKFDIVSSLCKLMKISKQQYRKEYLAPLRKHLGVVETLMCSGRWEEIDFSRVPSVAMNYYKKKAFPTHLKEKFAEYLASVSKGEAKINVGTLHPHEILSTYFSTSKKEDQATETQWEAFLDLMREKVLNGSALDRALTVVDCSGSMTNNNALPLKVAISLGLITAELCSGAFHNKWITFTREAKLEEIKGDSLFEKIQCFEEYKTVAENTNLQSVFDLLLTFATTFKVPESQMPKTIFIISDMQFDQAQRNYIGEDAEKTNFQAIEDKYQNAGYQRPAIVYWNVASPKIEFPVTENTERTAMISGFSPSLLNLFLELEDYTPYSIVMNTLNQPRYRSIHYVPPIEYADLPVLPKEVIEEAVEKDIVIEIPVGDNVKVHNVKVHNVEVHNVKVNKVEEDDLVSTSSDTSSLGSSDFDSTTDSSLDD